MKSSFGGKNLAPSISTYPYIPVKSPCKNPSLKLSVPINTVYEYFYAGLETLLKAQIANYGPQAAAMYATDNLNAYTGGVFVDSSCATTIKDCYTVNHAVIITGYGTDPDYGDYWLVKNSWGSSWGEYGYFRIARNRNNHCNIACWVMYTV